MSRVIDRIHFRKSTFCKADIVNNHAPTPAQLAGKRGLLVFRGHDRDNAVGHVTLWNGTRSADSCHLYADPNNGTFVPEKACLWELK